VRLLPFALALAFAPAASAALPNPCALLTNAEVAKALGSKVESRDVVAFPGSRGRTCEWKGANLASPNSYAVQRSVMITVSTATKAQFEKGARQTPGAVAVRGVGGAAYATTGVVKFFYAWQYGFTISVVAGNAIDPIQTAKAVAKLAVKRV
jgi:uncharacterized protein DUF3558